MIAEGLGLAEPRASYAPWDDFWYKAHPGYETNAGLQVSIDKIEQIAAVYCARAILSQTLAHVPLKVQKRLLRGKEVATSHPQYRLLHENANSIQTSMEFREQMMGDLVFRGNCYAEQWPSRGRTQELRPLNPDRMRPMLLSNFRVGYSYRNENNDSVAYTQDEIFHVRGYSKNIIEGMSPIEAMRESMGHTLALEMFGATMFRDGANHSAVFEHPGALSDLAYKRLQEDLAKRSGWNSAHGTRILEEGMKLNKTSMTAEQAQFLLSRKFQISEIARWFHIPPHLIGDLEKATFSNIEEQELEFVIYTMVPWFVRWEQRLNKSVVVDPETYFAEFVVDGLLRGDIQKRYGAYREGVLNGWLTRNEVRGKENMNASPGLDDFLVPQNMALVGPDGEITPINKPEEPGNGALPPPVDDDSEDEAQALAISRARRIERASARRVIRKEGMAVAKALARYGTEPVKLQNWAEKFYKDHGELISDALDIEPDRAEKFAEHQKERLLCSLKDNCANELLKEMEKAEPAAMLKFLQNGHGTAA